MDTYWCSSKTGRSFGDRNLGQSYYNGIIQSFNFHNNISSRQVLTTEIGKESMKSIYHALTHLTACHRWLHSFHSKLFWHVDILFQSLIVWLWWKGFVMEMLAIMNVCSLEIGWCTLTSMNWVKIVFDNDWLYIWQQTITWMDVELF